MAPIQRFLERAACKGDSVRIARNAALKVGLFQLVFGLAWIFVSDAIFWSDARTPTELHRIELIKGSLYIVVSVIYLFVVVYRVTSELVSQRNARERAEREVIERLAMAAEWRDDETGEHVRRVAQTAQVIAEEFGLDKLHCHRIGIAAAMHDVGKIGVPDEVIHFAGRYTPELRARMSAHTLIGGQILRNPESELMHTARNVALYHHERWDGTGYPEQSLGQNIPIEARITAVADVLDALFNRRRYKDAWPWEVAVNEIRSESGKHFDPEVVSAFIRCEDKVRAIYDLALQDSSESKRRYATEFSWIRSRVA